MKMQRGRIILVALGFLIIFSLGLTSTQVTKDEFNYNSLLKTATQKGFVRVILEMDVPEIKTLTAISTNFKTGTSKKSYSQFAFDADLELDKAISTTRDEILLQLNGTQYHINRTYSTVPAIALSCTPEALKRVVSIPGVLRVLEDKAFPLPKLQEKKLSRTEDPDHPMLGDSTHIIGADVSWGYGYSGSGWYVAILDTGILRTHAMFQGKNIVEQCYSLGEDYNNGDRGDCPNGRTEMSGLGAAAHYQPRFYHGTHVAGIAAGNDFSSHFGVARDANIIAVQVFSYFAAEDEVYTWNSDFVKGLEYIYLLRNTYPIASINLSLGGGYYSNYCNDSEAAQIIANLKSVGIATVIASGNEAYCNAVGDPSCVPGAIAVSATDKQDNESYFGNSSNLLVSLLAPGEYINSSIATSNTAYGSMSGTSMSTPHVTGAWAIIKSFDPNLSVDDILTTFKETGATIYNTHCAGNTPKPRINVADALLTLFRVAPPMNVAGEQVTNNAFLQLEYINVLTWEDNPRNADKNVVSYRVYIVNGNQETLLTSVPNSTHSYMVRNASKRVATTYSFASVDGNGVESPHYYYNLSF